MFRAPKPRFKVPAKIKKFSAGKDKNKPIKKTVKWQHGAKKNKRGRWILEPTGKTESTTYENSQDTFDYIRERKRKQKDRRRRRRERKLKEKAAKKAADK